MQKPTFRDFVIKAKKPEFVPTPVHRERVEHLIPEEKKKTGNFGAKGLFSFLIMILFVVGGIYQLTTMFSKVLVKVTPVEEKISLDDVFVANLNKTGIDSVSYKTMKVEDSASISLKAERGEVVSKKASGEIVVYNAYSEAPQRLISGTRFETPDGKIYKIDKAITVPGKKMIDGKSVPGSLTVTVYASEPGESYNISPSDFTLPGLKDGPRYKSVFARGKGNMTGGYVGELKVISPEVLASAKKNLIDSLVKKLEAKSLKQLPAGYLLFSDATFYDFKDNSADLGSKAIGNTFNLTMTGVAESAIFNEKELAQFLAKEKLSEVKNNKVHSPDLSGLDFKILGKAGLNISQQKSFSFKISGNTKIVWDFDSEDFKQNLAGLSKDDYQEIFKKYNMIEKAETVFKPSWSSSFPGDPERISVEIVEN